MPGGLQRTCGKRGALRAPDGQRNGAKRHDGSCGRRRGTAAVFLLQNPAEGKDVSAPAFHSSDAVLASVWAEELDAVGLEDRCLADKLAAGLGRLENDVQSEVPTARDRICMRRDLGTRR